MRELAYLYVAKVHMGIKVGWEIRIYWKDLGKTRGNKRTPGVVYDMCGFFTKTKRGEGIGNAGGNGKLHRRNATHRYTKPKARVGRDLMLVP